MVNIYGHVLLGNIISCRGPLFIAYLYKGLEMGAALFCSDPETGQMPEK